MILIFFKFYIIFSPCISLFSSFFFSLFVCFLFLKLNICLKAYWVRQWVAIGGKWLLENSENYFFLALYLCLFGFLGVGARVFEASFGGVSISQFNDFASRIQSFISCTATLHILFCMSKSNYVFVSNVVQGFRTTFLNRRN